MTTLNDDDNLKHFLVKVGHSEVEVQGVDRDDAVRNARKLLSKEMPRLWDMIYTMDISKFQVDEVN